jgi:tagatose 6-phosphate kinase
MRCVCFTLNAAVDTTYEVERLEHGGATRVLHQTSLPGGKGNNVARVLSSLGQHVVATGFSAGRAGAFIEAELAAYGVQASFYRVDGESRTCITVHERDSGAVSELLEAGPHIAAVDATAFLEHAEAVARGADVAVLSGSLPAGLDDDFYAVLLSRLRPVVALLVLDSSGRALRSGIAGRPDIVKPNRPELEDLVGRARDEADAALRARRLIVEGALAPGGQVLASFGRAGAALITGEFVLLQAPAQVAAVNSVGAGDAMTAGYLDALLRGESAANALSHASAVAAASTLESVAGVVHHHNIAAVRETLVSPVEIAVANNERSNA